MYSPDPYRGDGDTLWTIAETKAYSRSREELEKSAANAIRITLGPSVVEEPPFHWHGPVRLPRSLFDDSRIDVHLKESGEGSVTIVDVTFRFESTAKRIVPVLWLTNSLVGLPLVYVWREWSVRHARELARRSLDTLWMMFSPFQASPHAYR